ncbi:5-methyltetrahydrofolate--homocysteine methyltransferase [Alteromonas sp. 1_MG-2023]|uniref:5-methyltetrahydrofolate--homocysteine methyltransferase n=1 Tax=Alteromonas sp. 1_MG-2023 TaxID=3062669 RepID=UPI0026E34B24|nr:5-methyltetrahydrofolate--homocysteine methyltransferase [Alteromonas sp. 1_MG-2023]MDO6568565.1 5-methyltetrahydrofolate--homocysteine methyltransferase [Alteromonas sp. 1_MG-2023]
MTSYANALIEFVDGGVWREDHVEHLHDYKESPSLSDFTLEGSSPTHLVSHDSQLAVFFDGDADSSTPASVQVVTDTNIAAESTDISTLSYTVNMHGVAEPEDDMLISTVRRDDSVTFSANPILPDSVGVYHLHDGEYEQEQVFEGLCPDLHGSSINDDYVAFGCTGSVLVLHEHDDLYESVNIANDDVLNGLRVGSIFGHEDADTFIGLAAESASDTYVFVTIDPEAATMVEMDWEPEEGATPTAYGFSYDGEHFLILDDLGNLSVLSAHSETDTVTWELETRINISSGDLADMPDNVSFSMTVSQNAGYVYIVDPIAMHVLKIDLEGAEVVGDIEVDFVPSAVSWLGIAE